MKKYQQQFAFTMIELLVATAIAGLMITIIYQIFNTTGQAISTGNHISEIISNARTINQQLSDDGDQMIGPTDQGFLIILNKTINSDYIDRANPATSPANGTVRSDQLIFIRTRNGDEPICPGGTGTYAATANSALHQRVWYGHVQRVSPNATDNGALGVSPGLNNISTNWILGRQALFLSGTTASGIFINGVAYNATTSGYASFDELYRGPSDVSDYALEGTTLPAINAIVGDGSGYGVYLLSDQHTQATYASNAYLLTYGTERLRVNTAPDGNTFTSQQIAQLHPAFAENISDFIVEFAADLHTLASEDNTPDGNIDVDTNGNLKWYSRYADDTSTQSYQIDSGNGYTPFDDTNNPTPNSEAAFVWRHDDDAPFVGVIPGSAWPYLIRIRYRIHDELGQFESSFDNGSGTVTRISGRWFEQIIAVPRP